MATEDFTFEFPTTTTSSPPLPSVDSLPWWCIPSSPGRESSEEDEANGKKRDVVEVCVKMDNEGGGNVSDGDDDERMDLLWEDFNDEVVETDVSRRRVVGLGGGIGLKLAKGGGHDSGRRLSIVVLLKKLFFLHNSQRSLRKGIMI